MAGVAVLGAATVATGGLAAIAMPVRSANLIDQYPPFRPVVFLTFLHKLRQCHHLHSVCVCGRQVVAGTLQKAIQNPDCVSAFAKDLKGQLTEPPEGLCQMLKNGAKNIMVHKVLPEAKPFLEEAFEEYAGLDWQRVVRKTRVFAPFYTSTTENHHFTKTGSGQT